jgi:hypothetical protein
MFSWRTVAGVVLALLTFEAVLRQLVFGHITLDPRVGWVWRSTAVVHRLGEGWGVSHWRDDETRAHAEVPANAPRIVVAGDSFTEALQVDDNEVFSARLSNVNALNIGQSGHSAADYVAFGPEYRARFQPAWSVIEIGPSDLADDAFIPSKTHFEAGLKTKVIIMSSSGGRITGRLTLLRRYCDVLDYGLTRLQEYRSDARMPPLFRAADEQRRAVDRPGAVATIWPVAAEMSRLRAAYDGRLTFLFIPDYNGTPSPVELEFMITCHARQFSCVNFRGAFDDFRARGDAPFGFPNSKFGEGHLNSSGHAAAAALLQSELERLRGRGLF